MAKYITNFSTTRTHGARRPVCRRPHLPWIARHGMEPCRRLEPRLVVQSIHDARKSRDAASVESEGAATTRLASMRRCLGLRRAPIRTRSALQRKLTKTTRTRTSAPRLAAFVRCASCAVNRVRGSSLLALCGRTFHSTRRRASAVGTRCGRSRRGWRRGVRSVWPLSSHDDPFDGR